MKTSGNAAHTHDPIKEIENALRERVGLDAASIGSSLIHRSIRLRMKCNGMNNAQDYIKLLFSSRTEWNEMVESILVTETWFFRDSEPFNALVRLVQEEWLPANPGGRLRLLSLPCSSGEEPYSLAMALSDAGIALERLDIDAVDISALALSRARKGLYGKNSFRGNSFGFRNKYFRATANGFELHPSILKAVRFTEGNVLDENFQPPHGLYDFIFCRNLLIYFDRPTQKKALAKLSNLLATDGLVFVGAAEQVLVLDQGFVSAHLPMAFACRKGTSDPVGPGIPESPGLSHPDSIIETSPLAPGALQATADTVQPALVPADLNTARRLADEGRLQEAATICEAHLQNGKPSAQAYYLLGLVRDATGDPAAQDYYRKALYLEPNHHDSLLQLALWSQKNGQIALARRFRSRAQRVSLSK